MEKNYEELTTEILTEVMDGNGENSEGNKNEDGTTSNIIQTPEDIENGR